MDHVSAVSYTSLLEAKPKAPQSVNPIAPMRFHKPICQPRTLGAGMYHFDWVSSMKSQLEMMKPVPPTTFGWMSVSKLSEFLPLLDECC